MAFDPSSATLADGPSAFDPSTATLADDSSSSNPASAQSDAPPDPSAGGSTLQVYNPFGKDFDTGIKTGQTADRVLSGAGKGLVDTGRGIYQLGASIAHSAGMISDEKMAEIQKGVDDAKERDKPLMSTTAGKVGDIVGQAAPMLLAPELGVAGSAALGAASGAAQPVATGDSRLQNTALGGIGGTVGALGGKVLSAALRGAGGSGTRQAAVDALTAEGIPLSVAQKTGAKFPATVERASSMTGDDSADFAAQQGQAFNRAVLRRVGVDDPGVTAATPDVLGPARTRITGVMNDVADRTNIPVDEHFLNDLATVETNASRQLPASDLGPITQNITDILTHAADNGGQLDGTFYQKLNSNLSALAADARTAPIAGDLKDAVTDALQRSADPKDIAALTTARQQYRALKQIEPAIDAASGNISPLKLMSALSVKANRSQALYGNGDQTLMNLARAAKQVMPETLGNSGTAERSLPILSALEVLGSGEPIKAGIKLAVGTLGLNAAGKAMRNQGITGKYIAGGIPGLRNVSPLIDKLDVPTGVGVAESERGKDSQ